MRAAISLRLLLALTLAGWGQFASAASYYWYSSFFERSASSPSALCTSLNMSGAFIFTNSQKTSAQCLRNDGTQVSSTNMVRYGDSCPSGKVYNPQTGACDDPPQDCSTAPDIYSAQECTYIESIKRFSCPSTLSSNGCEYVPAPDGKTNCDISTSICVSRYGATGQQASPGTPECTDTTCANLPNDPGQAPENCVTNGTSTYCFEDQESGCGTFNGQEGCFEHESGCGFFNGTWGCYGTDQPQRNCGYANGQQICFDPNNPTQQIPETSPDHPKNGGNADGNENNDPKAPGDTSTGAQDGNQGATNEAIEQLGDGLGGKIDKTNSLLDGISGILDGVADGLGELTDGLLGEGYDGSGDANGGGIEGSGFEAGDALGQNLSQQMTQIAEEQSVSDELDLEHIAAEVDDLQFFGEGSQVAELLTFVDGLLPAHTGCVDYSIPVTLGDYSADIVLPMCRISALKPLLEWIIYIVTAIGLWNITYSTLRMENTKASKGGF